MFPSKWKKVRRLQHGWRAHLLEVDALRHELLALLEDGQVGVAAPFGVWVHLQPVALGDHEPRRAEALARDVYRHLGLEAHGRLGAAPADADAIMRTFSNA